MKRWGKLGLIGLMAAALLSGCGAADSKKESAAVQNGAAVDMANAADAKEADRFAAAPAERKALQDAGADEKAKREAAAPAAGGSGGFAAANQAAEGLNRKIIYKANLTMQVEDYGKAQSDIRDLAALSGGYILQFTENTSNFEQGGTFVIKVPASGFSSFLKDLEQIKLKTPMQRSIQGQDVSEEYVDLEARLKAKQVVEARLISFMEKAVKTDELVSFSNELGKVQEEIERIKGRMRFIDQNVSFSTVEIRVYQRLDGKTADAAGGQSPVWQRADRALKASAGFLKSFLEWLIVFAAGLLPILAVAAVIGVPLWYVLRARRRKSRERAERQRQLLLEQNKQLADQEQNQPEDLLEHE